MEKANTSGNKSKGKGAKQNYVYEIDPDSYGSPKRMGKNAE
jgi:hypothetical protein